MKAKLTQKRSFQTKQNLFFKMQQKYKAKILELPLMELNQYLYQKTSDNIFLRAPNFDKTTTFSEPINIDAFAKKPSFFEHLSKQIELTFISDEEKKIAYEIIGNLDDKGFYNEKIKDKNILKTIQSFDPIGVGAKDLKECLLLQLKEKNISYQIIDKYFDLLLKGKLSLIQKKLKISSEKIRKSILEILALNFNPRSIFENTISEIIIPDISIIQENGKITIRVNDFDFSLNQQYIDKTIKKSDFSYLINEAKWIISSLNKRKSSLYKISLYLLKRGCFSKNNYLTISQTSQDLSMHISSLSRAIKNKYIDVFGKIYPLEHFFSYHNTYQKEAIKILANILKKENKTFSDNALSLLMQKKGIKLSRRTVNKYRKKLNVQNSYIRKEQL